MQEEACHTGRVSPRASQYQFRRQQMEPSPRTEGETHGGSLGRVLFVRSGRHCAGDRNLPLVGGEAKRPKELRRLNLYNWTELRVRVFSLVTEVHMSHLFPVLWTLKEEE